MPLAPTQRPEHDRLAERFAAFRRQARPPLVLPLSAAEAARSVQQAQRRARLFAWPVFGPLARKLWRLARMWLRRDIAWSEKVLATPYLGGAALWLKAILTLGRFRREALEALARLSQELELTHRQGEQRFVQLATRLSESLVPWASGPSLPAEVYLALEARLRGGREQVQKRLAAYLPFARRAAALALPLADLGCGRGEWLDLLAAEGLPILGVDSSPVMVAECRARGHAVEEGDVLRWLMLRPDASLAMVSLFQVAEHLPAATLYALLREAWRALAPGGLLLVETPNPENLQVGAYGFWMDPTHRRPLPPPLLDALVGAAGFRTVEIVRSSPWPESQEEDGAYPPFLRKLLFCEQDYCVVAEKPQDVS